MVSDDDYECRCPAGFSGKNCEVNVDDCATKPCQNGGTCYDLVNYYKCHCLEGFGGWDCEVKVDDCTTKPCQNGGTCDDFRRLQYKCYCRPGFVGRNCEQNFIKLMDPKVLMLGYRSKE